MFRKHARIVVPVLAACAVMALTGCDDEGDWTSGDVIAIIQVAAQAAIAIISLFI